MAVLALVLTPLLPGATVVAALPHSLDLNGTSAFAEVADAPALDLVADWTIELWFKDAAGFRTGITAIGSFAWMAPAKLRQH
jgi:hypothetical protein